MIYNDLFTTFGKLSVEQRGELITAIINQVTDMHLDGEVSQLCELLSIPFVERAKKDIEKYRVKCERNRTNANKRWVEQEDATACDGIQEDATACDGIQEDATACDTEQSHYNITKQNNNITKQNNNITKCIESKPRAIFKKPSIEEVKAYIKENNYELDADHWYSYYESNGWMVGKNKMKDWKAAVRTWLRNGYGNINQGGAAAKPERPKSQIRGEGWVDKVHYNHW